MHGGSPAKTEVPLTLGKSVPLALGEAVLVFPQSHLEQGRDRFHGHWPLSLLYVPITSTRLSVRVRLPCVVLAAVAELLAMPYFCQVAYSQELPQVTTATRYRGPHIGAPSPSQLNNRLGAGGPRIATHWQTLTASQWCNVFPKHGTALLRLRIQKNLKVPQPYFCTLKTV